MKRNIVPLIILGVIFAAMAVYVAKKTREPSRAQAGIAPIKTDDTSELLSAHGRGSIHLGNAQIYKLTTTHIGQEVLCSQIGYEGDGLDEASLQSAEQDLIQQTSVHQDCLEGVMRRLNISLISERLKLDVAKSAAAERAEAIALLQTHPDGASEVLRTHYALGGSDPNSDVLELLNLLQIHTSCVDLARSIPRMKKISNPATESFDKLYRKLCRS